MTNIIYKDKNDIPDCNPRAKEVSMQYDSGKPRI